LQALTLQSWYGTPSMTPPAGMVEQFGSEPPVKHGHSELPEESVGGYVPNATTPIVIAGSFAFGLRSGVAASGKLLA